MLDLKVIDITLSDNAGWRDRFERYRHQVMVDPYCNEKWHNYTEAKLCIEEQLGAFLTIDPILQRIVRFESVYRPPHWPASVARICNRTWVDPAYRAPGLSRARDRNGERQTDRSYFRTYHQQLDCCRAKRIDLAVISRENVPTKTNSITAIFQQMSSAFTGWHLIDDAYFLVSPHRKAYSCWQKVIWHRLVPGAEQALAAIPTITADQFQRWFGRTPTP